MDLDYIKRIVLTSVFDTQYFSVAAKVSVISYLFYQLCWDFDYVDVLRALLSKNNYDFFEGAIKDE